MKIKTGVRGGALSRDHSLLTPMLGGISSIVAAASGKQGFRVWLWLWLVSCMVLEVVTRQGEQWFLCLQSDLL